MDRSLSSSHTHKAAVQNGYSIGDKLNIIFNLTIHVLYIRYWNLLFEIQLNQYFLLTLIQILTESRLSVISWHIHLSLPHLFTV